MANILVIGKYYPPFRGGTEAHTRDVCEMLAKKHNVTVVVFNHEAADKVERINDVDVIRCSRQAVIKGQPIAFSMLRKIRLSNVDLVHFHAPNFLGNWVLLRRLKSERRHIPVIITHHMEVWGRPRLKKLVMPIYHELVRRSATVLVTSRKNALLSQDLPPNTRTMAIPLGIDIEQFALTEADRELAQSWKRSLIGNAKAVGFVNRHVRYKGLDVLIQAVAELKGVHALIAGSGPGTGRAVELALRLGIADRIHFLGHIREEDKKRLFAALDVFTLPSTEITEAFGIAQLEAMAARVPGVASNLPTGVTDIAIDGRTALLAPPGEPLPLAHAVSRVLNDRTLARSLTANAWRHLTENFSKRMMLDRIERIIEARLEGITPKVPVEVTTDLLLQSAPGAPS